MKTATTVLAIVAARGRRCGQLLAGRPFAGACPRGCGQRGVRTGRGTQAAQAALLPQPDGAGRHLADAEEGPDGDGLHRRSTKARTSRRRRRAGVAQPGPHQHREDPEAGRAHRGRGDAPARQDRARRRPHRARRTAGVRGDRRSSRAMSSACTSTRPASRWPRASRCSRPTAPNSWRRSASTPSRCRACEAMKDAGAEAQAGMRQLADSSLARLRNWDLSPRAADGAGEVGSAAAHDQRSRRRCRASCPRRRRCRACASCPARCSTR